MNIYEIDKAITELIDEETGELLDIEAFTTLRMEREQKIENMALWYKECAAEAEAIKKEKLALEKRQKAAENRAKRLKEYIAEILCGEKFKTAKVAVSYRKSPAVEYDADFQEWAEKNLPEVLKYEVSVSKTEIERYINEGNELDKARIVARMSTIIK